MTGRGQTRRVGKCLARLWEFDGLYRRGVYTYPEPYRVVVQCAVCRKRRKVHAQLRWEVDRYDALNAWVCLPCFVRFDAPRLKRWLEMSE